MKVVVMALAMGVVMPAHAADPQAPLLQLRPKAGIAPAPSHSAAPFVVQPASEPDVDFIQQQPQHGKDNHFTCGGENGLCYDPTSGRIEIASARSYMPDIRGLRRETISLRRDRILFKYSF